MDKQNPHDDPSRRGFLRGLTTFPLLALLGGELPSPPSAVASTALQTFASSPSSKPSGRFLGIQIGARSFVDEGVEGVLDTLQAKCGVNVLLPAVFTYGRGLSGRQIPGQPLPDHGAQEYDEIHGGSYTALHSEFRNKSPLQDVRAPELGAFDILADVIPKAKARGVKTYALFEEAYNPRLMPGFEKIAEVGLDGEIGGGTCVNNPAARDFLAGLVEDWFRHNDLDGLMWESERQGPFNDTIGAHFGRFSGKQRIFCFCHYCTGKATSQGIDVGRAREGYSALGQWVNQTLQTTGRSGNGAFVSLWRVLMEYPEIILWEKFWFRSQEEVYALLYETVKQIKPSAQVGWHIMHLVTMSPFYQAEQAYARIAKYADFIKPCPYNNCAGPRFARYIRNVQSTVFRDLTAEQVLEFHYGLLRYEKEAPLDKLPTAGMSAAYVERETRRALHDVNGAAAIYPGIDVDIPTALDEKRTQAADVKAAVLAAFRGGAPGIVLSRKYAEMKLSNLAGAGEALRELA